MSLLSVFLIKYLSLQKIGAFKGKNMENDLFFNDSLKKNAI